MSQTPGKYQTHIGQSIPRVDGPDKVRGRTRYTADSPTPGIAHAVLLQAAIPHGRVVSADFTPAQEQPGVLYILTPDNCPKLKELPPELTQDLPAERRPPLADWNIYYAGQHLALLVAETLEQATHAASCVRFTYERHPAISSLSESLHDPKPPHDYGPVQSGAYQPDHFTKLEAEKLQYRRGRPPAQASASIAETYATPIEHHNPIETAATIARWDGDRLTLYDTTRWILGSRKTVARYLDIPEENVRVVCPFIGGAFGSKAFLWQHVVLAAVAAHQLARPVKLVFSREQMFTSAGHRPRTIQQVALAAAKDGSLLSTEHHTLTETSPTAHFVEPAGLHSRNLYTSPHAAITHTVARTHRPTPLFMRAPGEAPGLFALESAMDELAYSFNPPMDTLALRLKNEAHRDQDGDKPYGSKHLSACYEAAAARFGWSGHSLRPRSVTRNGRLVGYGMATATYPGRRLGASASATLSPDGCCVVRVATHELGNGVRTVLTQVAADASGLPVERILVRTGDSTYPEAPYSGASQTTASTGPAVQQAANLLRAEILELASADPNSPLYRRPSQEISLSNGCLQHGNGAESYVDLLARNPKSVSAKATAQPPDMEKVTHQSFGAHFVEVEVDEPLGHVRIVRWVGTYDGGTILNPKLARSQILGGILFGLGMTLLEETVYDESTGLPVNGNLGEYHVPVCADAPEFDLTFIERPDYQLNSLGVLGIGELGIVGAPAAIANAIFHATGRRHRSLPIRPEHVCGLT